MSRWYISRCRTRAGPWKRTPLVSASPVVWSWCWCQGSWTASRSLSPARVWTRLSEVRCTDPLPVGDVIRDDDSDVMKNNSSDVIETISTSADVLINNMQNKIKLHYLGMTWVWWVLYWVWHGYDGYYTGCDMGMMGIILGMTQGLTSAIIIR